MSESPDLAEEVLAELGRLTWAAINLEDAVRAIVRIVAPLTAKQQAKDPFDTGAIGARISAAVKELERSGIAAESARTWLEGARKALVERNEILHAVPVFFVPLEGTTPIEDTTGHRLHYFPNTEAGRQQQRSVTVQGLRPIVAHLKRAYEGWDALAVELYQQRKG